MNMLLEKKIELGDVIAVKLLSGEEVIGKLKAMGSVSISVTKPLVLGMQQSVNQTTGQPEVGMAFGPFMLSLADDSSVKFEYHAIITYVRARKEISDGYKQSISSIELPTTSSLVV